MQEPKKNYSQTLNLPQTSFPIKPNLIEIQSKILEKWESLNLYQKAGQEDQTKERFVLHIGPPYANGPLHSGHLLNISLKDFVAGYQRKKGKYVHLRPGWDCHGLPIELKVIKNLGLETTPRGEINKVSFMAKCREFVQTWATRQTSDMKFLGLLADYKNAYMTMSHDYQSKIVQMFGQFHKKDLIFRRNKAVPWCFHCGTTLAVSAEIEYKDRIDPSCYVLFELEGKPAELNNCPGIDNNEPLYMLAWTTTPWTLALNRGLCLKTDGEYAVVVSEGKTFVLAAALVEKVKEITGKELQYITTISASVFSGFYAKHPTDAASKSKIIFDPNVSLQEGTAIVHTAPGCGPEDYLLGVKNGLEIFSPITPQGHYTSDVRPDTLTGKHVAAGGKAILEMLETYGKIFFLSKIEHAYPHCWRCKNGLIFRATKQWFCDLDRSGVRKEVLEQVEKINFVPKSGSIRLSSFVSARAEWCISRQRIWGAPIPALICKECDTEFTSSEFIEFVSNQIAQKGIEWWATFNPSEVQDQSLVPKKACRCEESQWKTETDILDVWFDSGTSNQAVLATDNAFPADLYLEGSDQHRGWFQTSLICSTVASGQACSKTILTHGYVLDQFKQKLSKSLGNAKDAYELMRENGTDIMRLWAASVDYQRDVPLSEGSIENAKNAYKKVRNCLRFALANLSDWEKSQEFKPSLTGLDLLLLTSLLKLAEECEKCYEEYDFTGVFTKISTFCNNTLSADYYDSIKDRLYTLNKSNSMRLSAQWTLLQILDTINGLIAPLAPFLAEEVDSTYKKSETPIILREFANKGIIEQAIKDKVLELQVALCKKELCETAQKVIDLEKVSKNLFGLKHQCHKSIEGLRAAGIVPSSLEVCVEIFINPTSEDGRDLLDFLYSANSALEGSEEFLEDFLVTSGVKLTSEDVSLDKTELPWLMVRAVDLTKTHKKCLRCWKWRPELDKTEEICFRCVKALEQK